MASFNSITKLGILITKTLLPVKQPYIPSTVAKNIFPTPGFPIIKERFFNSITCFCSFGSKCEVK